MLFFAATALEKLSKVPPMFWVKVVAGFVAFLLVVFLLRKLFEINKVILIAVSVVTLSILWFQWIYERNEPEFMTPFVSAVAQFFPSKGAYQVNQQNDPKSPGISKSAPTKPTPQKR